MLRRIGIVLFGILSTHFLLTVSLILFRTGVRFYGHGGIAAPLGLMFSIVTTFTIGYFMGGYVWTFLAKEYRKC